jgi:ADP-heptose:LPS heptosyltransferase
MAAACGVPGAYDFRLPVPADWMARGLAALGQKPARPILVYRPLVERREWGGSTTRNPDREAYAELFAAIRRHFFVVSVADLEAGVEWTASAPVDVDVELHRGELGVEALAGLFAAAALVFCAPGFATVLAQAVGTRAVTVFGGYEDARSFSAGARLTRWLGIEPVNPCACWSHTHRCAKAIDLAAVLPRLEDFAHAARSAHNHPRHRHRLAAAEAHAAAVGR